MTEETKKTVQQKEQKTNSEKATDVSSKLDANVEQEQVKKTRWVQLRVLPIYVRVILVILLLAIVAIIGLCIGYGYIGDGEPNDVLKKATWTHIVDIIKGIE